MEVREKLDGREMGGASRHLTRFEEDIDRVDETIGMTREYNSSQNLLG